MFKISPENVMNLVPMLLSLTVHEWAHAWSAFKLGDDTALREGRLTLNPIAHIDPIGTLILPLLGIGFGWAKPVPVNPTRFRRDVSMGTGMAITAFAGPLSNLLIAIGCAIGLGFLIRSDGGDVERSAFYRLLTYSLSLNISLFLFNLLPIFPLDGSRILERLVPYRLRDQFETFKAASPFLLLLAVAGGSYFLAGPFRVIGSLLNGLVRAIAGI